MNLLFRTEIFLIWPLTALHRIDSSSPLYDVSAADLLKINFEIVVVLNGTVETTGQQTEARTSYIPNEILWGHRFRTLLKYYKKRRYGYAIDYSRFNQTVEVETPLCSAHELLLYSTAQSPTSLKSSPYILQEEQLPLSPIPFKLKIPSPRNLIKSPNFEIERNLSLSSQLPLNLNTCSPVVNLKYPKHSQNQESSTSQFPNNLTDYSPIMSVKSNFTLQEDQSACFQVPIKLKTNSLPPPLKPSAFL